MSRAATEKKVTALIFLKKLIDSGCFEAARELLATLDENTYSSGSDSSFSRFLQLKALVLFHQQEYQKALRTATWGLDLIKKTDENAEIAALQSTIARCYLELGDTDRAERVYRDLMSTYRRLDDLPGIIRTLNRLSRVYFNRGRFSKATEYLLEALDYAEETANHKSKAMILGNLGTIFNLTGRFCKAIDYLTESQRLNQQVANRLNLARTYLSLGYAQMHLKRFADARRSLQEAEVIIRADNYRAELQNLNQYLAELSLLSADFAKAGTFAELAYKQAETDSPTGSSVCQSLRLLADAYLGEENYLGALSNARKALALARKLDEQVEIGACLRISARIKTALGKHKAAEKDFAQAVAIFQECNADLELARTFLARSAVATNSEARQKYKAEAERLFQLLELESIYMPTRVTVEVTEQSELVGNSPEFAKLISETNATADSDIPILLLGNTGCGKDHLARYIHRHSPRAGKPFVVVNCAAIPDTLAESEFFGYERGAFTNAFTRKAGYFEAADGGTLFLNEIAELRPEMQAKLLAVLDEQCFFRLGTCEQTKVNFRLIAATNMDLQQAMAQGRFRNDLFYRLAVVTLKVPDLAARADDAFLIFKTFLRGAGITLAQVDETIINLLKSGMRSYNWPGNIRELKNLTDLFSITEKFDATRICCRMIKRFTEKGALESEQVNQPSLLKQMEQFERGLITSALQECGGVIRRAAAYLGCPESTLRTKLKKFRISAA